jgi:hypothetical protein
VALRALDGYLDSLPGPCGMGERDGGEPIILCLLAGLASLGLVLQTLVVEENLFADCPGKFIATVDTIY